MQRHDNCEGWMLNYKLPATGDGASLCHSNLDCHCVAYALFNSFAPFCMLLHISKWWWWLLILTLVLQFNKSTYFPFFHLINMRASGCWMCVRVRVSWTRAHVTQRERRMCLFLDLWYSTCGSNRSAAEIYSCGCLRGEYSLISGIQAEYPMSAWQCVLDMCDVHYFDALVLLPPVGWFQRGGASEHISDIYMQLHVDLRESCCLSLILWNNKNNNNRLASSPFSSLKSELEHFSFYDKRLTVCLRSCYNNRDQMFIICSRNSIRSLRRISC